MPYSKLAIFIPLPGCYSSSEHVQYVVRPSSVYSWHQSSLLYLHGISPCPSPSEGKSLKVRVLPSESTYILSPSPPLTHHWHMYKESWMFKCWLALFQGGSSEIVNTTGVDVKWEASISGDTMDMGYLTPWSGQHPPPREVWKDRYREWTVRVGSWRLLHCYFPAMVPLTRSKGELGTPGCPVSLLGRMFLPMPPCRYNEATSRTSGACFITGTMFTLIRYS